MYMQYSKQRFEQYRAFLKEEITHLVVYVAIFRRLQERKGDRLAEMNLAPAFFHYTISALYEAMILSSTKLLERGKGRASIYGFLGVVKSDIKIFSNAVTVDEIKTDKKLIDTLTCLRSIKHRRNKDTAHSDSQYAFDRVKIDEDAPLTWECIEEVIGTLKGIFNRYSVAYDGYRLIDPMNATDIDDLLGYLHDWRLASNK